MSEIVRFKDATQRAFAFAIRQIELNLEPKCEECGYGTARQKCPQDLGGYCKAYEQENKLAFDEVIRCLEYEGGLRGREMHLWRHRAPLEDMFRLSETEKDLFQDLYELHLAGKVHETRKADARLSSLCKKRIIEFSVQTKWKYQLSSRAITWAEALFDAPEEPTLDDIAARR